MEVSTDLKKRVIDGIKKSRNFFEGSDSKHAISLGINPAQYSRIMAGETDKVLSDAKWITLSRILEHGAGPDSSWKVAETPVFSFIQTMLKRCQRNAISSLLCDAADIGKTFAARHYTATNKNAVYVDCSQVKSKQKLVRKIAKEFGVNHTGRYADVYDDLVYYLNYISRPLIILDEAGDLQYDAFLELKALWNATERHCAWCMMGADGLKEKIRRAKDNKKVGFAEMFSRYGSRYQRITPEGKDESNKFLTLQAALIIKANAPKDTDVQAMLRNTNGSLRRIYNEVSKLD